MSKPEIITAPETVAPISSGDHCFIEDEQMKIKTMRGHFGETQLDKFAGLVLQGLFSANPSETIPDTVEDKKKTAEYCYDMAEYMMDEKRKREAVKDGK